MAIIIIIMASAVGGVLYRWRGGPAWLPAPRWLKLATCAAFLSLPALATLLRGGPSALADAVVAMGIMAAFWGLSRAHGSYMDLGHNGAGSESDWRWAELLLADLRSTPLREGLLLALTGLAATVGPGLAQVLQGDWSGWWLVAAGALKAPAYGLGWTLAKGRRSTEIGEWLTGAAWGATVGALLC